MHPFCLMHLFRAIVDMSTTKTALEFLFSEVLSTAHALKNVNRVIADYEQEEEMYSGRSYRNSYDDSSYRGRSYDEGRSYARGRGRNAKRDSMGRYSRDEYSRNDEYSRGDEYDHMMLKER